MRKRIFALVTLVLLLITHICAAMQIKMLNVGQGDAILIKTDNRNILVDTTDFNEREKLVAELKDADVNRIDTLILSHAHADHIGNANFVIRTYGVRSVYDNGYPTASKYARNYRNAIIEENCEYGKLQRGDIINLDDEVYLEVYYPGDEYAGLSVNNQSIVAKVIYKDFSMLLTGDMEAEAETDLLGSEVRALILKAAHHGSKTSSLANFVEAVAPQAVLISAGVNNKYGHPHAEAIGAYMAAGVNTGNIFCTAFNGTITVDTDGHEYTVAAQVNNDWAGEFRNKTITVRRARRIGGN